MSYLYRASTWFGTYDHWFPRLFWVALFIPVVYELLFLRQVLRYGHAELLPTVSRQSFRTLVVFATLASFPIWELTKNYLDDPLYLGSFALTIVLSPVFGIALVSRRGGGAGQSVGMWQAFTVMAGLWAAGSMIGFGAPFTSPLWVATVVVSVIGGAITVALIRGGVGSDASHPTEAPSDPLRGGGGRADVREAGHQQGS